MSGAPVKLRCASWEQLAAIYEKDLRRGALFLRSQNPPAVGTELKINLTLPTGSVVPLEARVERIVPPGGLGGRGPGVDLALTKVPPTMMWLIQSALGAARPAGAGAPGATAAAAAGAARLSSRAQSVRPAEDARPAVSAGPAAGEATSEAARRAPAPTVPLLSEEPEAAAAEDDLVEALEAELRALRAMNPFQVLGVSHTADDGEVRARFGELARRYHPDQFARYESERARALAGEIFILIREAYRKIGDAHSRATTLANLRAKAGAPGRPPARTSVADLPLPPPVPVSDRVVTMRNVGAAAGPPDAAPRAPADAGAPAGPPPVAGLSAQDLFGDLADLLGDPDPPDAPPIPIVTGPDVGGGEADRLLEAGRYEDALLAFEQELRRRPTDRASRVGRELARGFLCLAAQDRAEAAKHFEAALEVDPLNERAARELAALRRDATESRRGVLAKLLGRKR